MTDCAGCPREWTGLAECHCATCHRHFGGIYGFDLHRVGPVDSRSCADPAGLLDRYRKPKLERDFRRSGLVWVKPLSRSAAAGRKPPGQCKDTGEGF